jgi:hypothetical protein
VTEARRRTDGWHRPHPQIKVDVTGYNYSKLARQTCFESTNLISSNAPAPSSPPPRLSSPRLTHAVMAHGYSLRPNSKGRQRHQSTDETKEQVEGTSASTSTSTSTSTSSSSSEGRHKPLTDELEGESGTVDPCPATPDTPKAAHNSPWHSRSIATSSVISATTTRYRGPETGEEIQAARKREQARRTAEAARIRREQIARGYEEELRALHARIGALRRECEVKVERARKKSERDWAIKRGEVVVMVEEDGDGEEGDLVVWEDADGGEMAVDKHDTHKGMSSLTTNDDDDKQQSQWSSRSSTYYALSWSHRSESNFPPPPPLRKTQQQQHLSQRQRQQDDVERGPAGETHTVSHTGRRLPWDHPPSQGWKSSHSRPSWHSPSAAAAPANTIDGESHLIEFAWPAAHVRYV